jgi:hypothetical protein
MALKPKLLTREEFASLLTVGNCSAIDPPAAMPPRPTWRPTYRVKVHGRYSGQATDDHARQAADSAGFENESRLAMVEFQRT